MARHTRARGLRTVAERRTTCIRRIAVYASLGLVAGLLAFTSPTASAATGRVVAWGSNEAGQIDVPANLSVATEIDGGYIHSLALERDGTVVAWGYDNLGQLMVPPHSRTSSRSRRAGHTTSR